MAKFNVPVACPTRFDLERFAMNGQVPHPLALRRLADGFNHVLCVEKRQIFAYSTDWNSAPSGSSSDRIVWPVAFRSSRGTNGLIAQVGLVKSDGAGITAPLFRMSVHPLGGGAAVVTKDTYFNQRASGASVLPNDVNWQLIVLDGLSPDTEYEIHITAVNGARPVSIGIWERQAAGVTVTVAGQPSVLTVDDADDDVSNPGQFADDKDILDSGISKLVVASNEMLKHSRTHLLSYSGTVYEQVSSSGVAISGSTAYSRVVGHTFHIDTSLLKTLRRSGSTAVPVRLAVCCVRTAGTGTLSIGIYDIDAAAIVAEITGISAASPTTNGWYVTSEDLPAQDGRYEIHAKQSNGTTTHVLYGVSAWPYEP